MIPLWLIVAPIGIIVVIFLLCLGLSYETEQYQLYVFKPKFETKLRRLGVRSQFMKNIVREARGVKLNEKLSFLKQQKEWDDFIAWAFTWENTPEGHDFWQKISLTK